MNLFNIPASSTELCFDSNEFFKVRILMILKIIHKMTKMILNSRQIFLWMTFCTIIDIQLL